MNDKTILGLDITTAVSGIAGVSVATQITEILGTILTIISLVSVILSFILRIIGAVREARKEDSDGGKDITISEAVEIGEVVKDGLDDLSKKIEEEKNDNGNE